MKHNKIIFTETNCDFVGCYEWDDETEHIKEIGAAIIGNNRLKSYNFIDMNELDEAAEDLRFFNSGWCCMSIDDLINSLNSESKKIYKYACLRGYCQSDYNYLIYIDGTLTDQEIDYIEALYFGMYKTFTAEAESFGCVVCDYMYNNDAELKKNLAEQIGAAASDITIKIIDGYETKPKYKYI